MSVPTPKKGAHDAGARKSAGVKRRTSFYLPKDASKHLHISSRTSAREVIEALLKKFTVVDNPGKFALFERSERHDQGIHNICMLNTCLFLLVFVLLFNWDVFLNEVFFFYLYLYLQFIFVSCLMMSIPSACVWMLDPMRKSWVLFWKRTKLEKSMWV